MHSASGHSVQYCRVAKNHEGNMEEENKTATSSLNEISKDQLGNRMVGGGGGTLPTPTPFYNIKSFATYRLTVSH